MRSEMATIRATVIYEITKGSGSPIVLEVPIFPHYDCWAEGVSA